MKVRAGLAVSAIAVVLAIFPATTRAAAPQSSLAPLDACGGTARACSHFVLSLLNADRAKEHVAPLRLKAVQSLGRASCPGSLGHSQAMAASGKIWHENSHYPSASFPHNVCVASHYYGENVGVAYTGELLLDLKTLEQLMMAEPHGGSLCATTISHACNILNPRFTRVGVGIASVNGSTWLTEDFLG